MALKLKEDTITSTKRTLTVYVQIFDDTDPGTILATNAFTYQNDEALEGEIGQWFQNYKDGVQEEIDSLKNKMPGILSKIEEAHKAKG